jgi:DNA polymerase-3 subunit gamma/tau
MPPEGVLDEPRVASAARVFCFLFLYICYNLPMANKEKNPEISSVLYRKYRPSAWNEVVGQDHVVNVLKDSLASGRIAHAYLFAGSRGTGKTTIARIFAKALDVSPNDIYEIDAASNRGIDDIREIRDGVNVLPFESPYKVYIIDEVHMLTKEAFNALLKTLEEPPAHAMFVLATTETDKIPETVISRCQVFTFKKPSREILSDILSKTAKKEKYSLESGVADLIALLGDGSFRDALGILQKVLSSSKDSKVTLKEVEAITGAPKGTLVNDFISALSVRNKEKALSAIASAKEGNVGMKLFAALTLEKMRTILLIKNAPGLSKHLEEHVSADDWKVLSKIAAEPEKGVNSAMLASLLKAYDATEKAYIESLPLELAVIEVCS